MGNFAQNFDDSDCPDLSINWSMENVPCLRHLLYVIKDVNTRRVISDVINAFDEKVLQSEHRQTFRKGDCILYRFCWHFALVPCLKFKSIGLARF